MERHFGLVMPRRMQVEFSAIMQAHAVASEAEVDIETLWTLFAKTYLTYLGTAGKFVYKQHQLLADDARVKIRLDLECDGNMVTYIGTGAGPLDVAVHALNMGLRVDQFKERSAGAGADAQAWDIVETALVGERGTRFGVGSHADIAVAGVQAVISAAARWTYPSR